MKNFLTVLLLVPVFVFSQDNGVRFEQGLTWNAIKAKARSEHKMIFVDCFTTWCGPCRTMSQKVFPMPEVGQAMNAKFICVSVQMDSTNKDSKEVKDWYPDARFMEKEYKIDAYPSFLFFTEDGHPVHKFVGAFEKSEDFLAKVGDALQEDRQYYTLMEHYPQHAGDSAFLHHAIVAALAAGDGEDAARIGDMYVDCLKNPYSKDNLELITSATLSSKNKGFDLFLHHGTEVDTALGINTADNLLVVIIRKEEIPPVTGKNTPTVDWEVLYKKIKAKYPRQVLKAITSIQINYYAERRMWKEYGLSLVTYVNKLDDHKDMDRLNDLAWNVFLYCDDTSVLAAALDWSKFTFANDSDPNDNRIDTYAHLLYKCGDIHSALSWEQKALSLAAAKYGLNSNVYNKYSKVIQRMNKGDKLWE